MKALSTLIFVLFIIISNAQENLIGKYQNELGETLILKSDNTFEYTWRFDLASSWNVGTWSVEKDKYIYLTIDEIKDTLKTENKIELVLSSDKISNEITNHEYVINILSGGGQSRNLPPKKLRIQKEKLYTFSKEGSIQNKKLRSVMNANAFLKPWFERKIEE